MSEIDQLWYTWSPTGLGVTTGFRVRAASRNLLNTQSDRFNSLDRYQRYVLPQGVDAFAIPLEKTPTCLALLDTGSERILVHKRYIGKDLVGRPGVFFSHLLAGLPADFSAREAIALWYSAFWKTDDRSLNPPNTLELPTVSRQELQSYATSAQTNLLTTMNGADIEKYLPLVIQAFLTYETRLKLYIAAPSEVIAALMWGLTHSLPVSLLQGLTFSTYEHDLKNGTGLIIGTCWLSPRGDPPPTPQRLPAFCTEGTNLAINSYTGECSQLSNNTTRASFAEFATRYWLGNRQDRLDELLATAERLAISNTDAFLTLYKFFTAQSLTQDDMIHFLQTPTLVAELLGRENVQNTLIELILTHPQWWKESGKREIDNLRTQIPLATVLSSLARNAATRTTVAIEKGAEADLIALLALVGHSAPPLADYSVWTYLHQILSEPRIIAWMKTHRGIRHWLLESWGEISSFSLSTEQMLPWLEIKWNELEAFLALKLPDAWYARAIIDLLDASLTPLSLEAQRIIERDTKRFEAILQQLIQARDWQRATSYFAKLVQSSYPEKMKLLDILLSPENTQSVFLEQVLSSAQLTWDESLQVIERYGQRLLARPDLPSILVNFIGQYVRNLTMDNLEHLSTRRVLPVIHRSMNTSLFPSQFLSGELQTYLRSWSILADFINEPTLVPEALPTVADALPGLPEKMQPQVKQRLLQLLTTCVTSPDHLSSILGTLVPALAPSRLDLLLDMAEMERSLPQRPPHRLAWYVKEVLAAILRSGQQQRKQEMLHNFLGSLLKDAGRDVYEQVDREARNWPKPLQVEWNAYAGEHRPPSRLEQMNINLERPLALPRAKKALATRKIAAIGKAYSPEFKGYDKLTRDEYDVLVLAFNWVIACEQDDDGEIVKAYEAIYQHHYEQSFDFTPEEIKRFELARERWRALVNFRKALESKRAQEIVQAYTPVLINYQHFSQQERERVTLALKFVRAYNANDNAALAAIYDEIARSPHRELFAFMPEELQRMQSVIGQSSAAKGSSSPVTSQSPIVVIVNGHTITENLLVRMYHVKGAYVEFRIAQLQIQIARQPSSKESNQEKIKLLREKTKPEEFLQWTLDEFINDLLIQDSVQQGIIDNIFNSDNRILESKFQELKTYMLNHKSYQLFHNRQISDADLKQFLLIIDRYEQLTNYLRRKSIGNIGDWLSEQRRKAKIQYADEYDPKKKKGWLKRMGF